MAQIARYLAGLCLAAVVHVLGLRLSSGFFSIVDPFLILTVVHSLRHGPAWSAVGGSVAGLTEDALTGGLYGLFGFANTLVAYVSAQVQGRFVVQQPLQVALLCALAAALQVVTLSLLQFAMVAHGELPSAAATAAKMVTTGLAGSGLWMLTNRVRASISRRRLERSRRLRIDL
ncbi:MAG: rod shape-determining protein MreD [Acidobacteriota bacterium]